MRPLQASTSSLPGPCARRAARRVPDGHGRDPWRPEGAASIGDGGDRYSGDAGTGSSALRGDAALGPAFGWGSGNSALAVRAALLLVSVTRLHSVGIARDTFLRPSLYACNDVSGRVSSLALVSPSVSGLNSVLGWLVPVRRNTRSRGRQRNRRLGLPRCRGQTGPARLDAEWWHRENLRRATTCGL
jgi:hypothetical protein